MQAVGVTDIEKLKSKKATEEALRVDLILFSNKLSRFLQQFG